jgi:hypothetical protein
VVALPDAEESAEAVVALSTDGPVTTESEPVAVAAVDVAAEAPAKPKRRKTAKSTETDDVEGVSP